MLNIAKTRKEWFIKQLEALKKKGIPYTEIASSLGVKPQYLNLIKNADRGASEKLTMKLCKTFNINYNDLLEHIVNHEKQSSEINKPSTEISKRRIPMQDNSPNADNKENEWIDTGELFPNATSVIHHYGDSMEEYPCGSIVILKRMVDLNIIVWGRNYYVETKEIGVIKRLQDGGKNYIIGYSSNLKTYPDGHLIHEPIKIPKKDILQIHLVLGCVTKELSERIPTSSMQTL